MQQLAPLRNCLSIGSIPAQCSFLLKTNHKNGIENRCSLTSGGARGAGVSNT